MTIERATGGGLSYLHRPGDGVPVLLLHGVPGSAAAWRPVAGLLDGTRVVAPDLLGFGESADGDDLHAEAQARAVGSLLDELGIARAVVVGHDFGGPVALRLLEQRPKLATALLLASTNAFGDTPIPFPLSTIFAPVVGGLAATALFSAPSLRLLLRTGSSARLDAAAYVGDRRQAASIRTIFETSLRNLRALYEPLTPILASVDVPTTVLWGDRDPFFAVDHGRRTADAVDGAVFRVLAGAGHFLPGERPHAVADAVRALASAQASR